MKPFLFIAFIQFTFISISIAQPISVEPRDETTYTFKSYSVDCKRETIIENYEKGFLGTSVSYDELAWNGDVDNCIEGTISALAMERSLQRINYFRNLVGVENGVIFTEVKNQKCQKAVLMMDAENKLDHYPTEDWKCSSADGIQAAGKSNLSYGGHSSASIPQYIRDAGSGNGAVGHRRWILFPKAYEFGFGSTNWGTAMWVIGGTQNPESYPDFVAYPSPGHFPKNLIYPRWSFSKRGANFNDVKIKMYNESGENIEYIIEEITNGYGDNTLVWIPEINLYDVSQGTDAYFKVEIDSIKSGGEYISFEYEVLGIIPEKMDELASLIYPSCGNESGEIAIELATGYKNIIWSNGGQNTTKITGLSAGDYSVSITDKLGCESVLEFQLPSGNDPKILTEVSGNLTTFSNTNEIYKTDEFEEGNYTWTITNGQILDQTSKNEVEVVWDEGVSNGTLCVQFSDSGSCESNEICIEVELSTSSLPTLNFPQIQLFPNPATDNLLVKWQAHPDFKKINIYSVDGVKVNSLMTQKNQDQLHLNISDYESGMYLIQLQYENEVVIKKFIKE